MLSHIKYGILASYCIIADYHYDSVSEDVLRFDSIIAEFLLQ